MNRTYMKFLFREDTYNASVQICPLIAPTLSGGEGVTCPLGTTVVRVQPRLSKGITDLFSPHPSFRLQEFNLTPTVLQRHTPRGSAGGDRSNGAIPSMQLRSRPFC